MIKEKELNDSNNSNEVLDEALNSNEDEILLDKIKNLSITTAFRQYINPLKEYAKTHTPCTPLFTQFTIKKDLPEFFNYIKENYTLDWLKEIIYCILNDIDKIKLCPACGASLKVKTYNIGFLKTCSTACMGKMLHINENTQNKIISSMYSKTKEKHIKENSLLKGLDFEFNSHKNNYIIKNYCKHHRESDPLIVYRPILDKIREAGDSCTLCTECNRELYERYNPTDKEIDNHRKNFNEFYEINRNKINKDWMMMYYPKLLKAIIVYYEKMGGYVTFSDSFKKPYYTFMTGELVNKTTTVYNESENKLQYGRIIKSLDKEWEDSQKAENPSRSFSAKIRTNLKLEKELKENTGFLPDNAKEGERIYCYINKLKERPKCIYCNKRERVFNSLSFGYYNTCGCAECKKEGQVTGAKNQNHIHNNIKKFKV